MQAHGVATHGNFVQAGGSVSIVQNNYHGQAPPTINILGILSQIPNLRKIHMDILSKATPGTGVWLFKTKNFLLWIDPDGNVKILWGSGIRESAQRS